MNPLKLLFLLAICLTLTNCSSKKTKSGEAEDYASSENADMVDSEFGADDPFAELDRMEGEGFAAIPEPVEMSGDVGTYTVKKGDTLMKIAFDIYGDLNRWREIFNQNKDKLHKAGKIEVGMQLQYNAPKNKFSRNLLANSYLIKSGDTLGTISKDIYGKMSKWKKLYNFNRDLIRNPNKIYAGFSLYYDITPKELEEAKKLKNKMSQDSAPAENSAEGAVSALTPSETGLEQNSSTTRLAVAPTPAPVADAGK